MSRMNRFEWHSRQSRRRSKSVSRYDRRLRVEVLEDRRMLAMFTVANLDDAGVGSLRQAILDANAAGGADTINFSAGSGTITLATGEMAITDAVTISICQ